MTFEAPRSVSPFRHLIPASRLLRTGAIIVAALAMSAATAAASTGTIDLRLTGPNAASASITLTAADDPLRHWTMGPDSSGRALLTGLAPGPYMLVVDVKPAGQVALALRVEAVEVVVVDGTFAAGAAPRLVERERYREGQGQDLRRDDLRNLPASGSLWSLVETAVPGLISSRMDSGGVNRGDPALIGSRGASWTQGSYRLSQLDITNPIRTGTPLMYPDVGVFETIAVTSGVAPVEFGEPGAAMLLVPKRPGAPGHGSVQGSFTNHSLVASPVASAPPAISALDSFGNLGAQFTLPTKAVGVYVAADVTRSQHTERGQPANLTGDVASLFTTLTGQLDNGDDLRFLGSFQGITRPYVGRIQFQDGATLTEHDTFGQWQLEWDHGKPGNGRWRIAAGLARDNFSPNVLKSTAGGVVDILDTGAVPSVAAFEEVTRIEDRTEYEPRARRAAGLWHHLRFGASLDVILADSQQRGAPTVAEMVAGTPARVWVWQQQADIASRHAVELAGYVTDRMLLNDHLVLDAGLRLQRSSGSAKGASEGIGWNTLAPRLALRWSALRNVAVTGGYGRYHPRLPLSYLAWGDPNGPAATVYRWTDPNHNGLFDAGELGVPVAQAGAGPVGRIDPDLRAPYTNEFALGVETKVSASTTLRGSAVVRSEHHIIAQVNTGMPLSNYTTVQIPDQGVDYTSSSDDRLLTAYSRIPSALPTDMYQLTNPADNDARYGGIEITLEHRTKSFGLLVGAMAYRAEGPGGSAGSDVTENDQGVIGNTFSDPNNTAYRYGRLFFDRAYVLKWSTRYQGPHDFRVAATARYQDGQPSTRFVVAQGLTQGPELVPAFENGHTRFTYTLTLDARLEQGFRFGGHLRAALTLDAFNLTNLANEVEESLLTGPTYRQTSAIQPPRTVRLGFRFEF